MHQHRSAVCYRAHIHREVSSGRPVWWVESTPGAALDPFINFPAQLLFTHNLEDGAQLCAQARRWRERLRRWRDIKAGGICETAQRMAPALEQARDPAPE